MKSEERHELEQNELADWVTKAVERVRPYWMHALVGSLLAAGALVGWAYFTAAQRQATADAWEEYLAADSPELFEAIIKEYPDSPVVPYARLRIADYRFQEGKSKLVVDRSEALARLDEAIKLYQYISQDPQAPPDARERADLGVAMAAESKGALEEAKADYRRVADLYAGTPDAQFAQKRIDVLESPQAKQFYQQLSSYVPPTPSTDLPRRPGLESPFSPDVPLPPAMGAPSEARPILPDFQREKVDAKTDSSDQDKGGSKPAPKNDSPDKPAAEAPAKKEAAGGEKSSNPPAPAGKGEPPARKS